MTYTISEALKIYDEIMTNGKNKKEEKVTKTITAKKAEYDGFEYTFLFYNGVISKIEAFNHRELIEAFVK